MIKYFRIILPALKTLVIFLLLMTTPYSIAKSVLSVSLEQAVEQVRKSSEGKILSARTKSSNGQYKHRIQVLTPSGRVKIIEVPAFQLDSNRYNDENSNNSNDTRSRYNPRNSNQRDSNKPTRYQNNKQPTIKPNYQRTTKPNVKKESSGNKK